MAVKTYDEILADALKKADEEAKTRSAQSTTLINKQLQNTNAIIDSSLEGNLDIMDKTTSKTVEDIESEINKLPATYQSAYDVNEVQKRINEKQVEEHMANMGLTNSGLNATQQTALSVAKMNADNALTQKKYAQINSLKQQIADVKAAADLGKQKLKTEANLKKQQAAADAEAEIAENDLNIYDSYRSNSQTAAANEYNSQQKAIEEAVKAGHLQYSTDENGNISLKATTPTYKTQLSKDQYLNLITTYLRLDDNLYALDGQLEASFEGYDIADLVGKATALVTPTNWIVNGNKYTDCYGNTYTKSELENALQNAGFSKDIAKGWVKTIKNAAQKK